MIDEPRCCNLVCGVYIAVSIPMKVQLESHCQLGLGF